VVLLSPIAFEHYQAKEIFHRANVKEQSRFLIVIELELVPRRKFTL
jgi:hypothetical protein